MLGIEKLTRSGIRVTSVSEKLHVIHGKNRGRSPFSNSFLILDTLHILMDTGCGLDILETVLRTCGVDLVINSHSHPDHTAGNWLLQERGGPDILVPAECADSISRAVSLGVRFVGQDLSTLWRETYLPVTGFRDFTPSGYFTHGHEFVSGSLRFLALHSPGHLADHYCLYEPDQEIMIGFDIDLSPFGPWYGNRESEIPAFKRSIEKILQMPMGIYLSSHARPIRGAYIPKRLRTYASIFALRNDIISSSLNVSSPASLESLVNRSPFYGEPEQLIDPIMRYGEEQMVIKHLEELIGYGRVVKSEAGFIPVH